MTQSHDLAARPWLVTYLASGQMEKARRVDAATEAAAIEAADLDEGAENVAARPLTAVDFNQLRGDELRQRLRAEAAERRLEEAERKLDAAVPPSAYAGASQPQISEIITAAFHSIPTRATRRHRRLLDAVKAYEAENERLRWVVSALRDQLRQTCTVTGWADLVSDLEKLGSVKLAMRIAFAVGKDEGARAAYADLASFTEAKAGEVAHNRHASFQRAAEGKMSMANHPAQRVEWTIDAIRQIVAKGVAQWRAH